LTGGVEDRNKRLAKNQSWKKKRAFKYTAEKVREISPQKKRNDQKGSSSGDHNKVDPRKLEETHEGNLERETY